MVGLQSFFVFLCFIFGEFFVVCDFFLECVRNIGIVVYIDVGKIIMIEWILFYFGVVYKIGEVYDGVVVIDWMVQEWECGIIIIVVVILMVWQDYWINIIDMFGYVDFIIEVECFMCVLDGVIVVFCVVGGVQF